MKSFWKVDKHKQYKYNNIIICHTTNGEEKSYFDVSAISYTLSHNYPYK